MEEYKTTTRSEKLTKEQLLKPLKENCSYWDPFGPQYYSGVREGRGSPAADKGSYLYLDPTKYKRRSIEPENIHVWMMDNSPAFKDFPKYSESVIVSTTKKIKNLSDRGEYGTNYVVIPYNNSRLGKMEDHWVWGAWDNVEGEHVIRWFQMEMEDLLGISNDYLEKINSMEEFQTIAKNSSAQVALPNKEDLMIIGPDGVTSWKNPRSSQEHKIQMFLRNLENKFDPKTHGITSERVTKETYCHTQEGQNINCCYLEGPVLMIKYTEYENIIKDLESQVQESYNFMDFREWKFKNPIKK